MEIRLGRHSRQIAVVTIDNQRRLNAMTREMLSDLGRIWDELERDRECRCIVLTGAGERAFTVGADVSGDLSAGPEVARMVNHALLKLLTARLINAAEAARLGLVNRLVPQGELMRWAIETAEMIAANSPSVVQAVKRQVSATIADHALTREALEQQLGDEVRASPHFAEGISAFREKRKPHYE